MTSSHIMSAWNTFCLHYFLFEILFCLNIETKVVFAKNILDNLRNCLSFPKITFTEFTEWSTINSMLSLILLNLLYSLNLLPKLHIKMCIPIFISCSVLRCWIWKKSKHKPTNSAGVNVPSYSQVFLLVWNSSFSFSVSFLWSSQDKGKQNCENAIFQPSFSSYYGIFGWIILYPFWFLIKTTIN